MIRRLRTFALIINLKTLAIAGLSVASTWACREYGIVANFPLTLIATAIIFPIVFSINSAYKRRESVLDDYAALKADGRAIYYATRDWLENTDASKQERCRDLLGEMLSSTRALFVADRDEMATHEERVYVCFSKISKFIKTDLREAGLASGETSRCNQYLSKMMFAFEQIKHIYQYRTPRTLRAFSDFFITVLPILYGPYFAYIAQEYPATLLYVMPVLFSLILVSLDNIQAHLENPFDQIGQDDVLINAEKFTDRLQAGDTAATSSVEQASNDLDYGLAVKAEIA
jgi:hypothetical protein